MANIDEKKIIDDFNKNGFAIVNANFQHLDYMKDFITKFTKKNLIKNYNNKDFDYLNFYHKKSSIKDLNNNRLEIINKINKSKKFRNYFYLLFKDYLDIIVGNELVMQKRLSLSIQLPKDNSSLLPIHSDVWSGDSPFEVVTWLPLVNVYKTKSMYLLPPRHLYKLDKIFADDKFISSDELYKKLKKYVVWINLKYGQAIIFNQMLPHGNIVNKEKETRWTINCRFKSVFSPYGDKKIGEFFEPISLKPASKIAMKYQFPKIR